MAYQTRGRDPLFDSSMQAVIEKRGRELFGFILIALGFLVGAMIISYTPEDPSFMAVTDVPVQNLLGRTGASIAAPLFMIIGWSSWLLALVLVGWGVRFIVHKGSDRVLGRTVFIPIAVALSSIYASTLVPWDTWTHSYGLGGLFGDTVLGILLQIIPTSAALGIKIISLIMGLVIVCAAAFVLGFSMIELRVAGQFLLVGTILAYATLMRGLGQGTVGTVRFAQQVKQKRRQATFTAGASDFLQAASQADPQLQPDNTEAQVQAQAQAQPFTQSLINRGAESENLSFLSGFVKRTEPLIAPVAMPDQADMVAPDRIQGEMPPAELVERVQNIQLENPPDDAQIKVKIANVIKSRVDYASEVTAQTPTPAEESYENQLAMRGSEEATSWRESALNSFGDERLMNPDSAAFEDNFAQALNLEWDEAAPHDLARPHPVLTAAAASARKVVNHQPRKTLQASTRATAEAQPALQFDDKMTSFELPPLALLADASEVVRHHLSDEALEENARMLESVLDDYGVKGDIVSVRPGPVVTMYELEPAPGLKASRVIGLADDIARSMSALSARVSTVPGRSVIGIELPNDYREKVVLREILASRDFGDSTQSLPLALGKDIAGDPVVANLAKMPHLLIAGTTGSGKSVAINTMILSLLYKLTPDECRMIMIDPKMLELSVYDGIPHLLSPVVTDPKKAVVALKWVVGEMEDRYRRMSKMGVRNIDGFNSRVADTLAKNELFSRTVQTGFDEETGEPIFETEEFAPEKMPFIVVVVDEMADLMMVAGKEIEACIQRLAQMARASGIHLIMATQRPSVDVITGTIKANFPTRISFQVTSKIDSRTILGEMGAEQLLGMGDMLYMAGGAKISRCHGPFVSDEEVEEIVTYLKTFGPPNYVDTVLDGMGQDKSGDIDLVLGLGTSSEGEDALYDQAVAIVINDRKCSTSYIQRKLAIGYNKAARLVEQMESEGLVSAANHVGKRDILIPESQ
jgi:S-DNA-T family DNA segregation ATPase FtsK/SpoIIIE